MYNLKYIRADGKTITLNAANNLYVTKVTGANGYDVDIALSQGFQQIGETAGEITTGGQSISVNGLVLDADTATKKKLMSVFTPLTRGVLYWEGAFFINVIVKKTPTITQEKHSKFSLGLYAPFPFWQSVTQNYYQLGGVTKDFSFPVNFAAPHRFGTRSGDTYFNCYSAGNMPVDFELSISGTADIVNPSVTDVYRHTSTSFTGTVVLGQTLKMYRENGILRVTLTEDGVETDAFSMLDETSKLFQVQPGDNVLRAAANSGESTMTTSVIFYDAYAGVLADGV